MAVSKPVEGTSWSVDHPLIDLNAADVEQLVFRYDRDSDTLLVHLHGRARPAVSIEVGDNAYVRFDRAANEVVGLHLENFLQAIVPKHPRLLEHAAALGIDRTRVPGDGAPVRAPEAQRSADKRSALAALAPLFGRSVVVPSTPSP